MLRGCAGRAALRALTERSAARRRCRGFRATARAAAARLCCATASWCRAQGRARARASQPACWTWARRARATTRSLSDSTSAACRPAPSRSEERRGLAAMRCAGWVRGAPAEARGCCSTRQRRWPREEFRVPGIGCRQPTLHVFWWCFAACVTGQTLRDATRPPRYTRARSPLARARAAGRTASTMPLLAVLCSARCGAHRGAVARCSPDADADAAAARAQSAGGTRSSGGVKDASFVATLSARFVSLRARARQRDSERQHPAPKATVRDKTPKLQMEDCTASRCFRCLIALRAIV